MMKAKNETIAIPQVERTLPRELTLMDFAEVFLALPDASKREVLGYAKCLYATAGTRAGVGA